MNEKSLVKHENIEFVQLSDAEDFSGEIIIKEKATTKERMEQVKKSLANNDRLLMQQQAAIIDLDSIVNSSAETPKEDDGVAHPVSILNAVSHKKIDLPTQITDLESGTISIPVKTSKQVDEEKVEKEVVTPTVEPQAAVSPVVEQPIIETPTVEPPPVVETPVVETSVIENPTGEPTQPVQEQAVELQQQNNLIDGLPQELTQTTPEVVVGEETTVNPNIIKKQEALIAEENKDIKERNDKFKQIGKKEKNLIKKSIEVKKLEIKEIIIILNEEKKLRKKDLKTIDKFIDYYIKIKYLNSNEIKKTSVKRYNENIAKLMIKFTEELCSKTDKQKEVTIYNRILGYFLVLNRIDSIEKTQINELLFKNDYVTFDDVSTTLKNTKKVITLYDSIFSGYFKKLSSEIFKLEIEKIKHDDKTVELYLTNINCKMQFSKVYSEDFIDEAFDDTIITENLREVQLKLLMIELLKEIINCSSNNKYIIYFPNSIYNKEKKLKSITNSMFDTYTQSKILLLISFETLSQSYQTILDLKRRGFRFVIELSSHYLSSLDNLKQILPTVDYIFISDGKKSKKELKDIVPSYLLDKIIYTEETLYKGVNLK